jgi:hypothetical protein
MVQASGELAARLDRHHARLGRIFFILFVVRLQMSISVESLREKTVLDAALELHLHRARHRTPPGLDLSEVFHDVPAAELAKVKLKVGALIAMAYDVGDKCIASRFTNHGKLAAQLEVAHPGFSSDSYAKVIDFGCYLAR